MAKYGAGWKGAISPTTAARCSLRMLGARDPLTYRRDALVLEQGLLDEPENARYVFYLAQTYHDAGDPELALRHYRHRIGMSGWLEQVWCSLYQIARIKEGMGKPWEEVLPDYLTAYQAGNDRAEPLYHLGMHYQGKREFHLAHLFPATLYGLAGRTATAYSSRRHSTTTS